MPDKPDQEHLKGPFSSFAIALRNIRENLISKHDQIDRQSIQKEFLKEITTLSIYVIHTNADSSQKEKLYIEFPAAASLSTEPGASAEPLRIYSGEFPDAKISEMPREIQRINERVNRKLDELIKGESDEGAFGSDEFAFEGSKTEYPESLRKVKGYWRLQVKDFVFLVLYTYYAAEPNTSTEIVATVEDLDIAKTNFLAFLEEGRNHFVERIRDDLVSTPSVERSAPSSKAPKVTPDVPVLEDIVSRIQDEITKLLTKDSKKTSEGFKDAFSVVFVRTGLDSEGQLCFRYIFTNKQRRFLKDRPKSEITDEVENRRKQVLDDLHKRFVTYAWDPGKKIDDVFPLGEAIKSTAAGWKDDDDFEELLRTSIFAYYAFHPQTMRAFDEALAEASLQDGTLCMADSIESKDNWVSAQQAFLINQILKSKSSDVVSDFINHPFSKYSQYPTPRLIEIFLLEVTQLKSIVLKKQNESAEMLGPRLHQLFDRQPTLDQRHRSSPCPRRKRPNSSARCFHTPAASTGA